MHGDGIYTYKDGSIYSGGFYHGKAVDYVDSVKIATNNRSTYGDAGPRPNSVGYNPANNSAPVENRKDTNATYVRGNTSETDKRGSTPNKKGATVKFDDTVAKQEYERDNGEGGGGEGGEEGTNGIAFDDGAQEAYNQLFSVDTRTMQDMDYIGDINEKGEKHGKGLFKYKNGDIYEGDWISNKKHGKQYHVIRNQT